MINPKNIKPLKRGVSDFYSWQLYRWIKNTPERCEIWRGTWNSCAGVDRGSPTLYIGFMDSAINGERWLHGRMLRNLCLHGQSIESYAYGPGHDTSNWEDVSDLWWSEYRAKGICAIHGDIAHNWEVTDNSRKCRYCGKKEHRETRTVEQEFWSAAEEKSGDIVVAKLGD